MDLAIREALCRELSARGFTDGGLISPNQGLFFSDDYLEAMELGELLDVMVTRREKIFRSVPAVGQAIARANYDDAVAAVEAVKVVIARFTRTPP